MKNYEPSFADRLSVAAKAKRARLEDARAINPANDLGFAERQAARRALSVARQARVSERNAAKLADIARMAAEQTAKETARATALIAEQEGLNAKIAEQERREIALVAERKAARDARYAARKARQR